MESFDSVDTVVLHYETIMTWAIVGVVNIILVLPYVFSCRPGARNETMRGSISMMCTGYTFHLLPAFLLTDGHGLDGIDVIM